MKEYIDREEFLKRIKPYNTSDENDKALYNFALNNMIETPTADVIEREKIDKAIKEARLEYLKYDSYDNRLLASYWMGKAIKIFKRNIGDFDSVFNEFCYNIIKKMQEENARKALAKVLENERTLLLTDCGIIAHPKYKEVLPQVLELLEVKIPVVWSGMVEEQKIYLVTDEWLVQRMKEVYE